MRTFSSCSRSEALPSIVILPVSSTPEQIANNPQVISAYLGGDSNDDADGDSTAKVEPEPSVAKTIQEEGAR